MTTISDDMPVGIAEAARAIPDPNVRVTVLKRAIAEGKLSTVTDPFFPQGQVLVTLSGVRAFLAGEAVAAKAQSVPKKGKRTLKIKAS